MSNWQRKSSTVWPLHNNNVGHSEICSGDRCSSSCCPWLGPPQPTAPPCGHSYHHRGAFYSSFLWDFCTKCWLISGQFQQSACGQSGCFNQRQTDRQVDRCRHLKQPDCWVSRDGESTLSRDLITTWLIKVGLADLSVWICANSWMDMWPICACAWLFQAIQSLRFRVEMM